MSLITRALRQTCVYWATTGLNQFGQPVYGDAVELACRWVDGVEEVIIADGTKVLSKSNVMVSSDTVVGGILMLGELTDIVYPTETTKNEGAFEIIQTAKIPNLRATEFVRRAYL